jgi:hypothetical protein
MKIFVCIFCTSYVFFFMYIFCIFSSRSCGVVNISDIAILLGITNTDFGNRLHSLKTNWRNHMTTGSSPILKATILAWNSVVVMQ